LIWLYAIADHIVFYLAQKGITKAMYGLAYESVTVAMIQHSILLSQGLFTQRASVVLILHCLLSVAFDLCGLKSWRHIVALQVLDT
jgi:hypothetical protein